MKASSIILLLLLAAGAGVAGGYWYGHRHAAGSEEAAPEAAKADDKPTVSVQIAPIRQAALSRKIVAYGTVIAPPAEVRVVSVPFECRVRRILVAPGDAVTVDEPLVEVEASPATALAFEEARSAAESGNRDLDLVKQRYAQKLATNAELNAAQSAQRLAQGRLQNLQQAGAGKPRQLKSDSAGVVGKIDVQVGQVVPVGNPLIEVTPQKQIEVKLGIEPADAKNLKAGQNVSLRGVDRDSAGEITGTLRTLARRVDATSRLVDATVSLPGDANLILDEFVVGEISLSPVRGLYVPRQAVLPDEANQYTLFTVRDGIAVKHTVHVGLEVEGMVQVIADGLKEGDAVVVIGNFELDDGRKVAAHPWTPATTEPAATHPTTNDAGAASNSAGGAIVATEVTTPLQLTQGVSRGSVK